MNKQKTFLLGMGLYALWIFYWLFFTQNNHLLVAVLMVKNEQDVIEETLQPLVDGGIKAFCIYDTGSTDNTIVYAHQFFKKNKITDYVIEQEEWIDFAASRNKALRLVEKKFPTSVFMLMLDAEWILHGGKDLLRYCSEHQHTHEKLFFITLKSNTLEMPHPRLMRINAGIEFEGRVHELPKQRAEATVPSSVYFSYKQTRQSFERSRTRWKKDAEILLQDHKNNPDNAHIIFMLAQTYMDLQQYDDAIEWLQKRIASNIAGLTDQKDEEKFLSYFFIGYCYCKTNQEEKMLDVYQKAMQLRPHRAEPLIQMAWYFYRKKEYEKSFNYIKQSLTIPYPTGEFMYVFGYMYDSLRYLLASSMAYLFAEYELGLHATLQALETCKSPRDYAVLQKNLKGYQQVLQQYRKI